MDTHHEDLEDLCFSLAYLLVLEIERGLQAGRYFRDKDGKLLDRFDQVMVAIEEGRWPTDGDRGETQRLS